MIRIGWLRWDTDANQAYDLEDRPLPAAYVGSSYLTGCVGCGGECNKLGSPHGPEMEAHFPLENGVVVCLFGKVDLAGYWEIQLRGFIGDPDLMDYAIVNGDSVRHAEGHMLDGECESCYHFWGGLTADPGDREEFFEVLRGWGQYRVLQDA